MSLVYGSREVSVGPTVGYQSGESPAPLPAYVGKGQAHTQKGVSCISSLLNPGGGLVKRNGFCLDCKQGEEEERASPEASTETSSIVGGSVSSSIASEEEEEGEEEVESKFKAGLGTMGLLEESLPIKRGLSNFFGGKSKSFANLSDVTSVKDLAKPENPLNKRRRILMACKTGRFSTAFYSPLNTSMPNLALEEDSEEEEEENDKDPSPAPLPIQGRKFRCFKSSRSFSFTDLRDD